MPQHDTKAACAVCNAAGNLTPDPAIPPDRLPTLYCATCLQEKQRSHGAEGVIVVPDLIASASLRGAVESVVETRLRDLAEAVRLRDVPHRDHAANRVNEALALVRSFDSPVDDELRLVASWSLRSDVVESIIGYHVDQIASAVTDGRLDFRELRLHVPLLEFWWSVKCGLETDRDRDEQRLASVAWAVDDSMARLRGALDSGDVQLALAAVSTVEAAIPLLRGRTAGQVSS